LAVRAFRIAARRWRRNWGGLSYSGSQALVPIVPPAGRTRAEHQPSGRLHCDGPCSSSCSNPSDIGGWTRLEIGRWVLWAQNPRKRARWTNQRRLGCLSRARTVPAFGWLLSGDSQR